MMNTKTALKSLLIGTSLLLSVSLQAQKPRSLEEDIQRVEEMTDAELLNLLGRMAEVKRRGTKGYTIGGRGLAGGFIF
jgi:hypothetical protein